MTRKRKAEADFKGKNKTKKAKKGKKKGGRALEKDTTAKPNGSGTCKSKNLEKIPTYDVSKIPKGLLSIRDLSKAKKDQVEKQLKLEGLEYSFDMELEQD